MAVNLGSFKIGGVIYSINPTEYTAKGFPKRSLLLEVPQAIGETQKSTIAKFMTLGDETGSLDFYNVGDFVQILFKIDGFFWKKPETGEEIHLQSLKIVDIKKSANPFEVPAEAMSQDPDDNTPDHLAALAKDVHDFANNPKPPEEYQNDLPWDRQTDDDFFDNKGEDGEPILPF